MPSVVDGKNFASGVYISAWTASQAEFLDFFDRWDAVYKRSCRHLIQSTAHCPPGKLGGFLLSPMRVRYDRGGVAMVDPSTIPATLALLALLVAVLVAAALTRGNGE